MKFGLRIWRSGHVLINNERNKHLPGGLTQCLPGDCIAIMLHNELVMPPKCTLLRCQRGRAVAALPPGSGAGSRRCRPGTRRGPPQNLPTAGACPGTAGLGVPTLALQQARSAALSAQWQSQSSGGITNPARQGVSQPACAFPARESQARLARWDSGRWPCPALGPFPARHKPWNVFFHAPWGWLLLTLAAGAARGTFTPGNQGSILGACWKAKQLLRLCCFAYRIPFWSRTE